MKHDCFCEMIPDRLLFIEVAAAIYFKLKNINLLLTWDIDFDLSWKDNDYPGSDRTWL